MTIMSDCIGPILKYGTIFWISERTHLNFRRNCGKGIINRPRPKDGEPQSRHPRTKPVLLEISPFTDTPSNLTTVSSVQYLDVYRRYYILLESVSVEP
jgi:hypothetical protein